jgi:hypothetical protein
MGMTPQGVNVPLDALFSAPAVDKQGYFNFQWKQYFSAQNLGLGGTAPIESPDLVGTPTTPTAPPLTNDNQIASTQYTDSAVAVETIRAEAEEATLQGKITAETTRAEAAETALSAAITAETNRAQAAEALLAPLASPTFTGTVSMPTLNLTGATATTATAGAATLPANPLGFFNCVNEAGTPVKVPYYAV